MKKLIQTVMAIPIAEQIGKVFRRKSLLGTASEVVTAKLVLRSFGAMLALGAVAGGVSWFAGRNGKAADGTDEDPAPGAANERRSKGKSRKADKASTT